MKAPRRAAQRGLSGMLVIAVLVVMGAVSAYAFDLVTSVSSSYGRELAFSRARQAALAGLDWGQFRVRTGAAPICAAQQNLTSLPGAMGSYTITVRCALSSSRNESGVPIRSYALTSVACNVPAGGACPNPVASADYVEFQASTRSER